MTFKVYNTRTKQKELFKTYNENEVNMYTCGPTVYNYAHIGNLRTYIFEDVLRKTLEFDNYTVNHVMNVTDVGHLESDADDGEDKMLLGAIREKKTVWEIARFYEDAFFNDLEKLNVVKPTVVCRATEHIEDMIKFIKQLEEKGFTYISNGNVYFSIDKFPKYPDFARLQLEDLDAGNRIEVDENKKNPFDFVLWFTNSKFSNQIMQWDSPWGRGFPGWHIECSTMSIKYLGEYMDIHCGGIDHIPVHHTNEIAQSEALLNHEWGKYWIHGEFLIEEKGKMSKSKGDFLTVSKLEEKGYQPLDYRYYCLQSRYSKQLIFSYDKLTDAKMAYKKLSNRALDIKNNINGDINKDNINLYLDKFSKEINDDLNMPNALTVLWEVVKTDSLNNNEKWQLIDKFDSVLSLNLGKKMEVEIDKEEEEYILEMIEKRKQARKDKDFSLADEIRNELLEKKIEIKDTREGTTWVKLD